MESLTEDEDIPFEEQIKAEIEYCGTPVSVFPDKQGYFAVLEVDDRYSPKLRLFNIAKGTVGVMKVRKALYKKQPLAAGDVIQLIDWQKKPAYQYIDGKHVQRDHATELWCTKYILDRQ